MNLLQPKIILGAASLIALIILISLAQEMHRRLEVQRQVSLLEQKAAAAEKTIVEMQNLNQYFRTDAYQDRLAREKLNYVAPGEKVVLVPDDNTDATDKDAPKSEAAERQYSIPELWWRAFFVENKAGS